jgi:hypothetical protein
MLDVDLRISNILRQLLDSLCALSYIGACLDPISSIRVSSLTTQFLFQFEFMQAGTVLRDIRVSILVGRYPSLVNIQPYREGR